MTVVPPPSSPAPTVDAPASRLRVLLRNPLAVASMLVLVVLVVVAIVQPWILPYPPAKVTLDWTNLPPFSDGHLLGGDRFGRDILSRLIAGTREGLVSGLILTVVALGLGVGFGLVAGYFGKVFDGVSNWVFAVLMASPGVIILIGLYVLIGLTMPVAMATLGVLSSPGVFYLVRTLTITVRNELYVDAARVSGLSNLRIIGRHVLLAVKGPIIILAAFLTGGAISVSAGLQFLGLGNPADGSWGQMLSEAFANYYVAPIQLVWPGAALGLVIASFILLGNALRDLLEGTYVKPSRRSRQRTISHLLGGSAVEKTFGSASQARGERETSDDPLLAIAGLQIAYANRGKLTTVVEGASLTVERGQIVGLVGESGSGKTQTVLAVLGLLPDEAIVARGSIELDGQELLGLRSRDGARLRRSRMAFVPQEPMSNLDPSFTVGSQVVEGVRAQTGMARAAAKALALETFARVGLRNPRQVFRQYPHQISGGMAQRVLIAGAVACKPDLLIADEPTTALDVTVQAEVLDLLRDLQREIGMGVLLVTHNLGVVADLCDRVVVMRTGKIVEEGAVDRVLLHPQHDYTKQLLAAVLDETEARS